MHHISTTKSEIADSIERSYQSAERLDQITRIAMANLLWQVIDDHLNDVTAGKPPSAELCRVLDRLAPLPEGLKSSLGLIKQTNNALASEKEKRLREQVLCYYQQVVENLKNSRLPTQASCLEQLQPNNEAAKQLSTMILFVERIKDNVAGFETLLQDESLYKDPKDLRYAKAVAYTTEKTIRSLSMATPAILAGDANLLKAELDKALDFQRKCQQPTVTRKYLIKGAVLIADTFIGTAVAIGCITLFSCCCATPLGACGAGLLVAYAINRVLMYAYGKLKQKINKKITPRNKACKALEKHADTMQASLVQANTALGKVQRLAKSLKKDNIIPVELKRTELQASLERTQATIDNLVNQGAHDNNDNTVIFLKDMDHNIKYLAKRIAELSVEKVDSMVYERLLKELSALESFTYIIANHFEGIEQGDKSSIDIALTAIQNYKQECLSHFSTVKNGANYLGSELVMFANANVRVAISKLVGVIGLGVIFGAVRCGASVGREAARFSFRAFGFLGELPGYFGSKIVRKGLQKQVLNRVMMSSLLDPSCIKEDNQRVRAFFDQTTTALKDIKKQANAINAIELNEAKLGFSIQKC